MNRLLLFKWLYYFDLYIARTPGRHVILLVDNASPHGTIEIQPNLSNVIVIFLSKNRISVLQPLDFGIIASIKSRFPKHIVRRAVDLIDLGEYQNLYHMKILQASKAIYEIMSAMESEIIRNSGKKLL